MLFACFLGVGARGFCFYCAVVGEVLALGTLDDAAGLRMLDDAAGLGGVGMGGGFSGVEV